MPQSTAKKQLLEEGFDQNTPIKRVVPRQINSWMETNEKQDKNKKVAQPSRFKISRRLPPKQTMQNYQKQEQVQLESKQTPNISELKKRKQALMKTMSMKKWANENTKPNTAQQSTGQNKKPLEWFMKLPLVHVNQFIIEQRQKRQFMQATLIPELQAFPLKPNAITTRKSSMKRLERKQEKGNKSPYCHYRQSKRNNSAEMKELLQEKISKDKYVGLLASVSRKNSRLNYEIKMDRVSIRM